MSDLNSLSVIRRDLSISKSNFKFLNVSPYSSSPLQCIYFLCLGAKGIWLSILVLRCQTYSECILKLVLKSAAVSTNATTSHISTLFFVNMATMVVYKYSEIQCMATSCMSCIICPWVSFPSLCSMFNELHVQKKDISQTGRFFFFELFSKLNLWENA